MPHALVLNTASKAATTGGTFADTLTANSGDTLAIANFVNGGARIVKMWGIDSDSVAEIALTDSRFDSVHDPQYGVRLNMPARIQTINNEHDDGIQVGIPDDAQYFTAAQRLYPPGPCVVVFDGRTGKASGQEGVHTLMTDTLLGVYVIDDDMDEQRLDRKLKRMNAGLSAARYSALG